MKLHEMITALEALKAEQGGDVDVTVWVYGGGLDDLCNATPTFDAETQTVVIDAVGVHASEARR